MKEIVKVNYKAIFKYPEHSETMTYQEVGEYINDTYQQVTFCSGDMHFLIKVEGDTVLLKNNNTRLRLVMDKVVENEYHSPYGTMMLTTKLIGLQNDSTIKINYILLDGKEELTKVYILIRLTKLDN